MTVTRSWTSEGVDEDPREQARAAARRSGMSLGAWLESVINEPLRDETPPTRRRAEPRRERPETHHRRPVRDTWRPESDGDANDTDTVMDALAALARRVNHAETQAREAIRAAQARLSSPSRGHARGHAVDLEDMDRELAEVEDDLDAARADARRTAGRVARRLSEPRAPKGVDDPRFAAFAGVVGELERRLEDMGRRVDARERAPAKANPSQDLLESIRARLDGLAERIEGRDEAEHADRFDAAVRSIEQRISALTERVDRPVSVEPKVHDGLKALETRLAQLSTRVEAPLPPDPRVQSSLTSLEKRLAEIAQRIETPPPQPAPDPRLERIEGRLSDLSSLMERIDEAPRGRAAHDHLDWERDAATGGSDLAEAIRQIAERQHALEQSLDPGITARAIDERFRDLSDRLDRRFETSGTDRSIVGLQDQIRALAERIETSRSVTVDSEQIANLQRQVLALHRTIETAVSKTSLAAIVAEMKDLALKVDGLRRNGAPAPDLSRIEAQMTELRAAVEHAAPREAFQALERHIATLAQRLDRGVGVDASTFERIGKEIAELRGIVSEAMPADAFKAVVAEVRGLSDKVATLASRGEAAAIDALRREIGELRDHIRAPADQKVLAALETEIRALSRKVEGDTTHGAISALDERIRDLSERVERQHAPFPTDRLVADIRAQIGEAAASLAPVPETAIATIERRIAELSTKIEGARAPNVDTRHIERLESQIARIAEALQSTDGRLGSLDHIERSLSGAMERMDRTRDGALEAARQAASEATRAALADWPRHEAADPRTDAMIRTLQQNLAELRGLSDASEKRTQDTLSAVHDTLRMVVDRLSGMERAPAIAGGPDGAPLATIPAAERPGAALPRVSSGPDLATRVAPPAMPKPPSIPEAAAAVPVPQGDAKSRAREAAARAQAARADGADRALVADAPLEPGSGRPAKPAVSSAADAVRAAREKIRSGVEARPEAPPEDLRQRYIATARRALQTATSDVKARLLPEKGKEGQGSMDFTPAVPADAIDEKQAKGNPVVARLLETVKARRKPVIMAMAAIVIALAALMTARTFVGGGDGAETAAREQPAITSEAPTPVPTSPREVARAESAAPAQTALASRPTDPTPPTAAQPNPSVAPAAAEPSGSAPTAAAIPNLPAIPDGVTSQRLRTALAAGDSRALFEMGVRFSEGRGVQRDATQALQWFRIAAERGHAPSIYRVANLLERGQGVPRDLREAVRLYQRAAELGNRKAMHNLAALFASGAEGRADYDRAFPLFERAAEHGLVDSQYNLAVLHVNGLGTRQNLVEAYRWFAIGANNGDREAARKRDEIGARLDGQALVNARLAAQSFRPRAIDPAANEENVPPGVWEDIGPGARNTQSAPAETARPNLGINVGASQRRT